MTDLTSTRPDPVLFPGLAERQTIEDGLTRTLVAALRELPEGPVLPQFDGDALLDELKAFDFAEPRPLPELLAWTVEQMRHGLVHVNHPRYFGLFNPAPAFPSECADRIAAAFNPQLATFTTSPFAVSIEAHVISAVGRQAGLTSDVAGHFTSGGSEANYTATICALSQSEPGFAATGARAFAGQPVFYVSKDCHLAWVKIAHQAGIGRRAVRFVATDGHGCLDVSALRDMLRADRDAGMVPIMIVATAGTTNAGMIDPIGGCAEIARENRLWFHVDAAWGGGLIASESHRDFLSGMDQADSVTIDAHKWLSTTMGCGMFLTPHPEVLAATFHVAADFMPSNLHGRDPYVTSTQWSRRFAGLKLFLNLSAAAWQGYGKLIDTAIELARYLEAGLKQLGWTVVNDSPVAVVCAIPPAGTPPVRELVARLCSSGRVWCSTATFENIEVVRACISNGMTTHADVTRALDEFEALAHT